MPKTLLAVDDSATMRKVLEITFAGEDFRVVAAEGSQSAIARLTEGPVAAVIDTSLADDGYALARELRGRDPRLAIVMLSSRYSPYDANRGRDAGADDFADKPFDTQALIDKVKKAMVARENVKVAAPAAAPAPPQPIQIISAPGPSPRATQPAVPPQRPAAPALRAPTLSFESPPSPSPGPPLARTAPSGTPVVVQPAVARPAAPAATSPAPAAPVTPIEYMARTAVPPKMAEPGANGELAGKLVDLGLTAAQVDAVLALSREVIERVVWEVVPQLAETLIKEEIARLTKEG